MASTPAIRPVNPIMYTANFISVFKINEIEAAINFLTLI
jgi:hypothetical protein